MHGFWESILRYQKFFRSENYSWKRRIRLKGDEKNSCFFFNQSLKDWRGRWWQCLDQFWLEQQHRWKMFFFVESETEQKSMTSDRRGSHTNPSRTFLQISWTICGQSFIVIGRGHLRTSPRWLTISRIFSEVDRKLVYLRCFSIK